MTPGGYFGRSLWVSAMLAFSGVITGGPLMLFAYAARRIPYATVGLVQYLNPTLQFAVAVALFGEPFSLWHGVAFLGRSPVASVPKVQKWLEENVAEVSHCYRNAQFLCLAMLPTSVLSSRFRLV